ncbi:MAG: lipid asymmetry maintenance protein MlaB [Granulosicoccus sp.]
MSASVALNTDAGSARCLITGTLDFNTAREVLDSVTPYIAEHATLDIDLSGVTRANSAGLALLIEWLATARRVDHVVTFHHIPDGLRQLAGVCQVDGLI